MGELFRAWDTRLEREVALKVIHPELAADAERLSRFEQEAKAAARLDHPNIVVVHDVGVHEGSPYIVSELLEGESLRESLGSPLPPKRAVEIAKEIAQGLSAAHEKGIVHRDLKPENVFVRTDGRIKILDFGVAKLTQPSSGSLDTEARTVTVTEPGSVMGTVGYMSPEQVQGKTVDARSDLFSFGVVLYEMLSGTNPFRRGTAPETLTAILREEPSDLSEANRNIGPALERTVRHCLEKDPGRRFQSARDVLFDLESVSDQLGTKPVAPMSAAGVFLHRHRAGVAIAALVAILAVGGGLWWKTKGGTGAGKRLAVLPFENLSGDPEQEYLSDGLTQEMIAQLGRLHPASLSVIARTSVMQYKKTTKPVDQIGRELGVDYVLEGSARREGGRIRIAAELIEVRRQAQLWADSFERDLSGILDLQSEVSRKVASALALRLLPAERARLASARPVNPEAYDAYLKASHYWIRLTAADLDTAERYLNLALEKDPSFAPAHACPAIVWADRQQMGFTPPNVAGPKAKAAARRALELDDNVALAHFAMAGVLTWTDWDLVAAEREWSRAIELNPGDALARAAYSHYLMIMGRPDEAMAQIEAALKGDPFAVIPRSFYGVGLTYLRRYEEVLAAFRDALRMQPGHPGALTTAWAAFGRLGRQKEAFETAKEYVAAAYQDREVERACDEGYAHGGYSEAMRRGGDALVARSQRSFVMPQDIASFYLESGDKARTLDWLEKGYEVRDPNTLYLANPYWFDALRSEPRYQALLRRMNLPVS